MGGRDDDLAGDAMLPVAAVDDGLGDLVVGERGEGGVVGGAGAERGEIGAQVGELGGDMESGSPTKARRTASMRDQRARVAPVASSMRSPRAKAASRAGRLTALEWPYIHANAPRESLVFSLRQPRFEPACDSLKVSKDPKTLESHEQK